MADQGDFSPQQIADANQASAFRRSPGLDGRNPYYTQNDRTAPLRSVDQPGVERGAGVQAQGPQGPNIQGPSFRDRQLQYLQELQLAAQGQGDSRAQQYLRAAHQQAYGGIQSNISSMRNQSYAAQMNAIRNQQAASNQGYNLDTRSLKAQEQAAASQALMTELNYLGNQDINDAQAAQDFQQRMQAYNDQMTSFSEQMRFQQALKARENRISMARIKEGMDLQTQQMYDQYGKAAAQAAATGLAAYGKSQQTNQPQQQQPVVQQNTSQPATNTGTPFDDGTNQMPSSEGYA